MTEKVLEISKKINEATNIIRRRTLVKPSIGIILGTGLGNVANEIEIELIIPYDEISHFPISTVEFHKGNLLFGKLSGKEIVAMQGRFHYYEGYTMDEITFPIRVLKELGIKTLIISNACGSMNPNIRASEIVLIEDHINLLGDNPLIGINDDSFGPRFTDMSEPYSKRLIEIALKVAKRNNIKLHKGVYVAMTGPSLETRAEYRFLRLIGADVVGMSTVPENIVARQMGIEVLGFSVVTDECYPDTLEPVNIELVLATARKAEPDLSLLVREVVKEL